MYIYASSATGLYILFVYQRSVKFLAVSQYVLTNILEIRIYVCFYSLS